MVVIMKIGRKVPRNFFKQAVSRVAKFLTFQENMWIIIGSAFKMAKQECEREEKYTIMTVTNREENDDDIKWKWEWKIITIASPIAEQEELYHSKLGTFYEKVGAIRNALNKDFDEKADLNKAPNSKVMSASEFKKAKEAGFGALNDNTISNKLLDMGIVTDLKWIRDKTTTSERILDEHPETPPNIPIA